MISLLTSMKPFRGDAARIQTNTLKNWRRLGPDVEIILYGGGEGIAEHAQQFGAKHVPAIRSTPKGVPDFSAIAEHAAAQAQFDTQVYLNGDILLPPDFVTQIKRISFDQFLVTGRRIDLAQAAVFDPLVTDWEAAINTCLQAGHAELHRAVAQDYFAFPRGQWKELAPLIVGRGFYDNALLAYCFRRRIPIVDASWSILVVHQWHDYSHVKGVGESLRGDDAMANARLHDVAHSTPDLDDVDWQMRREGIVKTQGCSSPLRRFEIVVRYRWGFKWLSYAIRAVTRLAWLAGCCKPRDLSLKEVLKTSEHG